MLLFRPDTYAGAPPFSRNLFLPFAALLIHCNGTVLHNWNYIRENKSYNTCCPWSAGLEFLPFKPWRCLIYFVYKIMIHFRSRRIRFSNSNFIWIRFSSNWVNFTSKYYYISTDFVSISYIIFFISEQWNKFGIYTVIVFFF